MASSNVGKKGGQDRKDAFWKVWVRGGHGDVVHKFENWYRTIPLEG